MQIDERALNFIQKAKAAGFSQQEVYEELLAKGYEIGAPRVEQPTEPEKSPYSTMDKVKYTLRAAGEAAPIGMGDLVAGYAATQARNVADITHGKDLKTKLQGAKRFVDYMTPIGQVKMIKEGTFGKERADFIKEQEEFAKHHGGLNFLGEMVGGALTGGVGAAKNVIGKQGIKALMGAGAREGAKFGTAYGAGSGLTQDPDKISVYDALKGAAIGGSGGALTGVALPLAFGGAKATGRGIGKFLGTKKAAERGASEIFDAAGGTGIDAVVASDEGTTALREGIKSDKKIAKKIKKIANEKIINSVNETKDIIRKTLGAEDIEEAKAKAAKHYADVIASDPIYVSPKIYDNTALKQAVQKAFKEDAKDELKKRGVSSLYGVQKVKEKLDTMIENSKTFGDYMVRKNTPYTSDLQAVKEAFLNQIDSIAPQYKQARAEYEEAIAPYDLLAGLLKNQGRDRSDTINSILTHKNEAAIRKVFGNKKAEELLTALRTQAEQNKHFNTLYNDASTELIKPSPSSNKNLARETLESRGSVGGTILDIISLGGRKRLRRNIAEILLSGKNPNIKAITPKAMPEQSGQSIAGYLGGKIKEKGGYAWKDLADNATTEKLLKPRDFVSENFVSEVDNFLKDNSISNYQKIDMGQIPWIYMANGLEEQPLRTNKLSIRKAMGLLTPAELKANPKWHNHNVPKNVIDKMPELIADPLAIFKSNTEKGKYIAVLDAQVKGDPVLAVISPGKDGGYTFMPTAYEKGSFANFVKNTQEANNVVYVDGKRSLLPHTHLQAVSVGNKDPKHSIATKEGLVKRYFENRKKLFKNSKAVDEGGKLIELYHGTDGDFDTFDMSKGRSNMDIKGAFFSPWELDAKGYGKNVRSFYLNLTNPADEQTAYKALRKYQGQNNAGEKAKQDLIRQGYDGVNNGNEEYIAFFPEQIKSVFNRGTFSPKTGNVYKSLIGGLGISQILRNKENK